MQPQKNAFCQEIYLKTILVNYSFIYLFIYLFGQQGGAIVSAVASQQEGPRFESESKCLNMQTLRSLHVLPVSVWVYSGFLPQSKNM